MVEEDAVVEIVPAKVERGKELGIVLGIAPWVLFVRVVVGTDEDADAALREAVDSVVVNEPAGVTVVLVVVVEDELASEIVWGEVPAS